MSFFQSGLFKLNSGKISNWKIGCDAFTDEDIETLALMVKQIIGSFSSVEGIPRGGVKLAKALEKYIDKTSKHSHLIVDDVLTTGTSMERWLDNSDQEQEIKGAVIFARGKCPRWISPVFQLPKELWID